MLDARSLESLARACRDDMLAYFTFVDRNYRTNAFHTYLARQLAPILARGHGRVIISAPPQSGKSEFVSRKLPAYILGRYPHKKIIAASYGEELVQLNGAAVRDLVGSAEHAAVFPEAVLRSDTTAKDYFATANGRYLGTTVRGGATGFGADCLVAGTLVATPAGDVPIEALRAGDSVYAFDVAAKRVTVRAVQAVAQRRTDETYRIRTAAGRVVEATGNHPVFASGRFVKASAVAPGEALVRLLPDGVRAAGVCAAQGVGARLRDGVLLSRLPRQGGQHDVCRLPSDHPKGEQVLLGMPANYEGVAADAEPAARGALRAVQRALHGGASRARAVRAVLRKALRGLGARHQDVWQRQPKVEAWRAAGSGAAAFSACVPVHAIGSAGAGWPTVRGLLIGGAPARPSHRQQPDEQRRVEPRDVMRGVPSQGTRDARREAVEDSVALVERVRGEQTVYDIQVEGDHNFFADGLLVHNCFIIDDPFKDRTEADSITVQTAIWNWFQAVAYTRLAEDSVLIIMHTRWSENDLVGQALEKLKHEDWLVINLPALAEADDLMGRKTGEALVPERFSVQALHRIRQTMGGEDGRDWLALYQGKPRPDGGGEFKEQWLQYYTNADAGRGMNKLIVVDPASGRRGKEADNDYTSMWVIGLGADENFYALDYVRDRLNLAERTDLLFRLHRKWRPNHATRYEHYGMQADIEHIRGEMERKQYRFKIVEVGGSVDKKNRIRRLIPIFSSGRFFLPAQLWYTTKAGETIDLIHDFREIEYKPFPVGRYYDSLDSLARIAEPNEKHDPNLVLTWPDGVDRNAPVVAPWAVIDHEVAY